MNYITPNNILSNRFKDDIMPKWRYAILCFRDIKGSQYIMDLFNARPIERKVLYGIEVCEDNPFVFEADIYGEKVIIVTRCIWGAPQAAIIIEELLCFGVEYIVGYGAAGSINENLKKGDQIVAGKGLRTDGTSSIYKNAELLADKGMHELVLSVGSMLNIAMKEVCFSTVDALYKESEELINVWRQQGADAISMETSTFYAVINEYNKKGIWVGHISDCLLKEWEDWHYEREEMSLTTAKICKEVVKRIISIT